MPATRIVENIPNCPLHEQAFCPVEAPSPRELGPVAPRRDILGDMVIARSLRLGSLPILSIPAVRTHVLRGGQIACSRQRPRRACAPTCISASMQGDILRHAVWRAEFAKRKSKARSCPGRREFCFDKFQPIRSSRRGLNPKAAFVDDRISKIAIQLESARCRFLLASRSKTGEEPVKLMQESRSGFSPRVSGDLARYPSRRYERLIAFSRSVLNPSDEETPETR